MARTKMDEGLREERVREILEAATRVFAREGRAATMAHIAEEAGVSQGLAYRYFPGKEAILTSIVRQAAESGGGPAAKVARLEGSPLTKLETLVTFIVNHRRERPEFYQLLHQALGDDELSADLRKVVKRNGDVIVSFMRKLIVEGQASGEIAGDDPDQLLLALMACFDGLTGRAAVLASGESGSHFPDARIFLRMLRPDATGSRVR